MHASWMAFRECGWPSFLCLLIALIGLGVGFLGVILLLTRSRNAAAILGVVAIVLGVATLGAGFIGRQRGLALSEAAVSDTSFDPSQRARILAMGEAEATQCIKVGSVMGALPFLLGALAAAVGLATRKNAARG
jgi:disulfide bond formation protein DsbB